MSRTSLEQRLEAVDHVLGAGRAILPEPVAERAAAIGKSAGERLRHGTEFTVAALAGATGSGKSSLFNALVGENIARTGVTRPTTSEARAAVFGDVAAAGPLLDWLGVKQRHGVAGTSSLDGLILIDLPDHDSVEVEHRMQVDHFVEIVDAFIWVLDPQKYADQALHAGYLNALSLHGDVMIFVLNQADRLPTAEHAAWEADARRLLRADGIEDPEIILTSAANGLGIAALRAELESRVSRRATALARIDADLRALATDLAPLAAPPPGRDKRADRKELASGLAEAAGATVVGEAVAAGYRHDAALATGWPFTRWIKKLRRHPLRRLQPAAAPERPTAPTAIPIDEPRLDLALKTYADSRATGAPPAWARRLRGAASSRREELIPQLGRQVLGAARDGTTAPRWWRAFGWLQGLLATATSAGAIWLIALLVLDWLRVPTDRITPEYEGWPIPTLLLVGGAVAGLLVALLGRLIAKLAAGRRGRRARKRAAEAVAALAEELVAQPVDAELQAWQEVADSVARVAGQR